MKALVYLGNEKIKYMDMPDPVLDEENNTLVRITAVGVCGSDVQGFLGRTGRRNPPLIMGHEMAGEVVSTLGSSELKPGDKVAILGFVNCGECEFCRAGRTNFCCQPKRNLGILSEHGGMCDYITINDHQLVKVRDDMDMGVCSLAEPLAVAYAGAKKLGEPKPDTRILLIGAGTIGLMALASIKYLGHENVDVCDINPRRLKLARGMGASNAFTFDELEQGAHYDLVLDAVGIPPTYARSLQQVKTGGTIVWVGNASKEVTLPIPGIVMREITIKGSYIYNNSEILEAIAMLQSGRMDLGSLIELRAPLSQGEEIFERLAHKREDIIKAVLIP